MIKTKSGNHLTPGSETAQSSSMASSGLKKSDRYVKHIGLRVSVAELGEGVLRFFEAGEDLKVCGVELDEPNGDCDGQDLDGNNHFQCPENHGIYLSMKEVTLLDANGQPIVKKAKAKRPKKFESPPSLRKKITRKQPTGTTRGSTAAAGGGKSTKSKNPASKATVTAGAAAAAEKKRLNAGARKKVDHLTKQSHGIAAGVADYANADRKVIKRSAPAPAPAPATDVDATGDDDELPDLADDDDDVVDGAKFVRQVPTDWIEAAKQKQADEEAAIEREKEAADLAAQEIRLAEATQKRELEEDEFNKKAEEAALKRDFEKQERIKKRQEQAAERLAKRAETEKKALIEINEYHQMNENELKRREEKDLKVQQQRSAQKARIAALMSKVKSASAGSTPASSSMVPAPESPKPTAASVDPMSPDVDL